MLSIEGDPWSILMLRCSGPQRHLVHILVSSFPSILSRSAHAIRQIIPGRFPCSCIVHLLGGFKCILPLLGLERFLIFEQKLHIFILIESDQIDEARFDHIGITFFRTVLTRKLPFSRDNF